MTGGENKDIRIISAEEIYDFIDEDRIKEDYPLYVLNKAAREGATTSLTSVAINRGTLIVVIEPTNKITTETIGRDGIYYSEKPETPMHYLYSNKKCLLIQEKLAKAPMLNYLPYLLLPKRCDHCDYYLECRFAEVMRDKTIPVIATNYAKLAYMQAGSKNDDSVTFWQHDKLMQSQIFLFDEIQYLQNLSPINVPIIFASKDDLKGHDKLNFERYRSEIAHLVKDYPNIDEVMRKFEKIVRHKSVKEKVKKVLLGAFDGNYWEKHISEPIDNPYYIKSNDKVTKLTINFAIEMEKLVSNNDYGRLDVEYDLLRLYNILNIVCTKIITVGFNSGNTGVTINVSSINVITLKMMKEFLSDLIRRYKTIILTSATISDLTTDLYSEYWLPENTRIKDLLFGIDGSPLHTNEKLLIICDTRKLDHKGSDSLHNPDKLNEITGKIIRIIDTHNIKNCKIVAKSINEAKILLKSLKDMNVNVTLGVTDDPNILQMTWYKATDTVGVASDKRVWITVGFAYKPVNRFNNATHDLEPSILKNHFENQCDFFQTIMRAKGDTPSVVFTLGVTYDECVTATTWGTRRRIRKTGPNTNDIIVECDRYIPGPKIVQCNNFEQMLFESVCHMNIDKNNPLLTPYCQFKPLNELNGAQSCFEAFGPENGTDSPLINYKGTNRAKIRSEISYVKFHSMIFTQKTFSSFKKDVMEHKHDKKVLKTPIITSDGKAKWIRFGNLNNIDKEKLTSYFNYASIPYTIERVSHKDKDMFNVWVFLVPVNAKKAKHFGQYVINLLTVNKLFLKPGEEEKEFKCELFPNYIDRDTRKKHEIKLPCGKNSTILVNDEYTNSFEKINIDLLDLTNINVEAFGMKVTILKDRFDRVVEKRLSLEEEDIIEPIEVQQDIVSMQKVQEWFDKFNKMVEYRTIHPLTKDEVVEWNRIVEASMIRFILDEKVEIQLNNWWEGLQKPKYRNLLELSMAS